MTEYNSLRKGQKAAVNNRVVKMYEGKLNFKTREKILLEAKKL